MAKKFRCTVCGYIHEGDSAPEKCPLCKVPAEKFVEVEEQEGDLTFVTEHKIGDGKGADEELWKGLQDLEPIPYVFSSMILSPALLTDRLYIPSMQSMCLQNSLR